MHVERGTNLLVLVSALMPFAAILPASVARSDGASIALLAVLHAIGVTCGFRAFLRLRVQCPPVARYALIGPAVTLVGWCTCGCMWRLNA